MTNRVKLQEELEKILGNRNVYYKPPETLKIDYPCIVYELRRKTSMKADNRKYLFNTAYIITYISKKSNDEIIEKLLNSFEYSSHDRRYITDGLYHNTFTIYY